MSKYVGICARVASQSGLKFQVGPMGTSVEGSLEDTLDLVRRAVDACMHEPALESQRMLLNIQADVRPGSNANRLSSKMATIQAVLSRVPDADKQ